MKLFFLRDLFCWSLTKIQCSHQLCCTSESGGWKAEAAHTWVHSTQSYTQQQFDVWQCHMAQCGLLFKRCGCCYLDYSITVVWQGRSEFLWISHSISSDSTSEEIKMSSVLCKVTQNSKSQEQKLTTFRSLSDVAKGVYSVLYMVLWAFIHSPVHILWRNSVWKWLKLLNKIIDIS